MRARLVFAAILFTSLASIAAPRVLKSEDDLRTMGFAKDRVIFVGETDHYDKTLQPTEIKILEAIDASNKAARKCLVLEADPQFDDAFQVLSKSTDAETLAKANAILDSHDLMTSSIHWIGDTYPLSQFEFAARHGWTVRSGDMLRGADYYEIANAETPPSEDWSNYHVIYLRNQFLAKRIVHLLKTDCDLAVVLYGSAHFTMTKAIPEFKVRITPVPTLLGKIPSTTIFAVNAKTYSWAAWMEDAPRIPERAPDAVFFIP